MGDFGFIFLRAWINRPSPLSCAWMATETGKVQREFGADVETPKLPLHACGLKHGFSLQKDVPLSPSGVISDAKLDGYLSIDLRVSRSELLEEHDLNE